jgi:hypothetical protein
MHLVETLLITAWAVWIGLYFRLVWKLSGTAIPNYVMAFFPMLLPFDSCWRLGSEIVRLKLWLGALGLVIVQAMLHFSGVLRVT